MNSLRSESHTAGEMEELQVPRDLQHRADEQATSPSVEMKPVALGSPAPLSDHSPWHKALQPSLVSLCSCTFFLSDQSPKSTWLSCTCFLVLFLPCVPSGTALWGPM